MKPLTDKELEALTLARQGNSQGMSCYKLGISQSAYKQRINSARAKLEARNIAQAVAEAIIKGYIK